MAESTGTTPDDKKWFGIGSAPKSIFKAGIYTLVIFFFAVIGYNFGAPLIWFTYVANFFWEVFNLIAGWIGVPGISPFFLDYAYVAVKNGSGFILNGVFGWWLVRNFVSGTDKKSSAKNLTSNLFNVFIIFPLIWIFLSLVITTVYTGYIPFADTTISPSVCDIQNSVQVSLGLSSVSCDISSITAAIERQEEEAEFAAATGTGILGRIFSPIIDATGAGRVFKSQDVVDERVINSDAGSTLSDLRAPKLSYTANNRVAEDIKILANIDAKNLFLNQPGNSKIEVKIGPSISDSQCKCTGFSCLAEEINDPFYALDPLEDNPLEFNVDNVEAWCGEKWTCGISGIAEDDVVAPNTFNLGSGFHQEITCVRPGLSLSEEIFVDETTGDVKYDGLGKPFYVDVDFSYEGTAAANKQLFVIDKNVARQEEDPITALDLQEFIISNSYNDGRVTLGIGTDTLYEFVTPTYDEDFSSDVLELGLSFKVNRYPGGYSAEVRKVTLWVQVLDDSIDFVCGNEGLPIKNELTNYEWKVLDPCEIGERSGNFIYEGPDETESYHKFVIDAENADDLGARTELNVGEFANYDIDMFIPSEVLAGASYQGILIESEVEYTYTTRDDVLIRVTHDEFVED